VSSPRRPKARFRFNRRNTRDPKATLTDNIAGHALFPIDPAERRLNQ
jgi:hypothetical protein